MIFTSTAREAIGPDVRPEDPKPWDGNTAPPAFPDENRFEYEVGLELVFNDIALGYDPRPGHRAPQNPILADFRSAVSDPRNKGMSPSEVALAWTQEPGHFMNYDVPEHVEHAWKVLTGLARWR